MQDMVKRILEIEQHARELTEELETMKSQTEMNIDEKVDTLRTSYLERARHRIEITRQFELEKAEKTWQEQEKINEQIADQLNETYVKNHEIWVAQIVDRVLGR